ncbi:biotin transporter BioY [Zhengella mangrovi]|uniref:Biotin transporter n=1 Tax=Zhengella mangrovi TaxID=1982044 RepID=A0A2G1QP40_9HYPH|nr:biotin transporter BioY [Zhengella mangrovi]PHP67283.1 biotin transporter BioY [Zhengella mangrovi]
MTLFSALHRGRGESLARAALAALAGSLLLTLSAKVQVPFWPVPMTMQTFVVIGLGLALGPRLGLAAVALYLAEGAAGLPVFAGTPEKGIGLAYMAGPTGGYLAGYLLAAVVAGQLAGRGWDRHPLTAFAAALLAGALIYLPGLAWLGTIIGWDKPVLAFGLWPFVYGDILKAALAAAVFPAAWAWIRNKGAA